MELLLREIHQSSSSVSATGQLQASTQNQATNNNTNGTSSPFTSATEKTPQASFVRLVVKAVMLQIKHTKYRKEDLRSLKK